MKTLLKFILIALFCISKIKSACTGTGVAQSACTGTSCKWTKTADGTCTGTDCTTTDATTENACDVASTKCTWNPPLGTCADKTCADYDTQNACNAVSTCQWSDDECSTKSSTNTPTTENGAFGLKNSILIFLISFLF